MTPKTLDKYIAALKKKAAAGGWSQVEYELELDKIQDEMTGQFTDGKITQSEYEKVVKQISNAFKSMTLQGKQKTEAPKEQTTYSKIYDWLVDISDDEIDGMDAMSLTDMVEYLKKSNTDPNQAKKQLEAAVDLIKNNGFTAEEAMNLAAGYKPGMKAQSAPQQGMTKDEYTELVKALEKKNAAGIITDAEWKALADKLDKAYKGGKKASEIEKEIGCDPGTLATDESIIKLGNEFKGVYGEAAKELKTKLDAFLQKISPELDELNQKVLDGTITPEEYNHLRLLTIKKKIMDQQVDQLTGVMLNANQKAMKLINGEQLNVFAENANYQSYQLTQDTKLNLMFSIYDEHTAEKLLKDKPELLPRKEVDGKKDKPWNQKIMANAVLQGVIQGESIPQLAKRIAMQTGETNMKAMVRYARTAMTSAQNSGRMEMLHRAQGMGIQCKKVWMATLDSRTRDSHQHLDGVAVGIDEKFPNKLMFPGDPDGAPAEVYNCRCTLTYDYEGFPNDPGLDKRIQYDEYVTTETDAEGKEHKVYHRESSLVQNMTYDEWKAAKSQDKMNALSDAKYQLAEAQKAFIKAKVKEDKVYEGLWKDPVTLADYPDKKDGIQAKHDWYTAKIEEYKQAQAQGLSWATQDKIDELVKKRKLLKEFETNGQLLEKRNAALKAVQDLYDQVGFQQTAKAPEIAKDAPKKAKKKDAADATAALDLSSAGEKKTQFAPNAWDEKTKKAAKKYNSRSTADKDLRPELDDVWDSLTDAQKYAAWEYTRNSNPINKSLSGYHDSWSRSNFIGHDKTVWGHEDSWRDIPREFKAFGMDGHVTYHDVITNLTNAIEKTVFTKGRWLVRGSDNNGLAGMLEGAGMDFNQIKGLLDRGNLEEIKRALVGQKAVNHAFTSTGIASDAGFSGEVKYSIYAPEGTKAMYAEPQSYYGNTIGGAEIYKKGKKYRGVGSEAEVIVQRGTAYVIRDVTQNGRGIEVVMEIVEQPDYFVNGDEDTFNGGKTRHKR